MAQGATAVVAGHRELGYFLGLGWLGGLRHGRPFRLLHRLGEELDTLTGRADE